MIHCPTCGAGLRFDIETKQMACDHCDNHFRVRSIEDNVSFDAKGHRVFELNVFICPDCGAELAVDDPNDAVGFCPYCGGASMLFDRVRESWVPDGVIPFQITKEQCKQAYVEEVRKHPFVSKKYSDPNLIESFRGIYMPYWSFECKQETPYKVQGTEDENIVGENYIIRRTFEQWYGTDYTITGLSHDASSNFDDHISEHIAPYDEEGIAKFHPGFLSGFYAEIGDMDHETYTRYAQEKCQDFTSGQVPYSMTNEEMRSIKTDVTSLSNVLYPVWFMSYRRKNKISYAAVNGQTGKVSADLPLSPLRIVAAAVALAAALFVLFCLLMPILPSLKASSLLIVCAAVAFASGCFLTESLLGTLKQSLRLDNLPIPGIGEGPWAAFSSGGGVAAILTLVIGILFVVTDGSYKGGFWSIGLMLSLCGTGALIAWACLQVYFERYNKDALKTSKASQLENGIAKTYLKCKVPSYVLRAILCVTCIVAAILGIIDFGNKAACYALCVALGVEVLTYAVFQIVFQTKIAERRPPQMSKKGALYDTN